MELLPFLRKYHSVYLRFTALGIIVVLSFAATQVFLVYPQATLLHFIVPTLLGTIIGLLLSTLIALRKEVLAGRDIFRAVADLAQEFIYVLRKDGVYEYVSPSCLEVTGYRQQDFYERPFLMNDLVITEDRQLWGEHVHRMHARGHKERLRVRIRRRDGELRWLEHLCSDVHDSNGDVLGVRSTNLDITERVDRELQQAVAATAFETHEGIIITDGQSRIMRVNRAFCDITGYEAVEVIGKTPALLKSGRQDGDFYEKMWATLIAEGRWDGELWDRRKNGEVYPKQLTITAVRDDAGKVSHYVGMFSDISLRKEAEAEIFRLAYYDPLTLLPNRRLLMDRLHQAMTASERNDSYGAVLFIDLDHFKELNDTQGHAVGDKLLVEVARRLVSSVRTGDTVARLGGDEFVVMLANLFDSDEGVGLHAESVASKVLEALNRPYVLEGRKYQGTASIGVTLFHGRQSSADELLKHSDVALYQAKNSGRARLRFFDPSMQQALEKRARMKADLRIALQENQFRLYFQPQVDAAGRCVAAEVLLRWQHPEQGLLLPGEFIPFAEESGLIGLIDLWVLAESCRQIRNWDELKVFAGLRLSVNISAAAFMHHDFVAVVLANVYAHRIEPARLKLELTETSLIHNLTDAIERMRQLKSDGIGFSLDDFGTGYSSLSYLRQLPIDQLKIDRAFVCNVTVESGDAVIAKTIIGMAHNLGLELIAEGVETQEQFALLDSFDCPGFQGYLFSRPVSLGDFEKWLAAHELSLRC